MQIHSATPTTLSKLNLQLIADGKHSVPTTIELVVDGGKQKRILHLPAVTDQKAADSTVSAPVSFAPVTGSTFRFVITGERRETTTDYFTHEPLEVPVAIAELGAPGLKVAAASASLPSTCRTDLLKIDGKPVGVQIGGSTTAAIARDGLQVQLCGKPGDAFRGHPHPDHSARQQHRHRSGPAPPQLVRQRRRGATRPTRSPAPSAPPRPPARMCPR